MSTVSAPAAQAYPTRSVLTPRLRRLLRSRWVPWIFILASLAGFVLVILTGLFGTMTGNQNFAIVFVWIVWWFALIAILVPLMSRSWCAICPLPAGGEWLQRGSLVEHKTRTWGLNRKWPRRLNNLWTVNFLFLGIALFSPIITTNPRVTGFLLLGLMIVPIPLALIYSKRAFCRYVCPVGGFLGLYSNFSWLELRANEKAVCQHHLGKECIKGSVEGYACPWMEFPQTLGRNAYCGLCLECLKTCPKENIDIRLRPFGADLLKDAKDKDASEAWKSLIMLELAGVYLVVLLGPYGYLKDWATFRAGLDHFLLYTGLFVGGALLFVPFLFLLLTHLSRVLGGRPQASLRRLFIDNAVALVPLGLFAWIAFSVALLQVNWSYIFATASDPFGWGWDLLGTKAMAWQPILPQTLPYIQIALVLIGLAYTVTALHRLSLRHFETRRAAAKALVPMAAFAFVATATFLRLFVG